MRYSGEQKKPDIIFDKIVRQTIPNHIRHIKPQQTTTNHIMSSFFAPDCKYINKYFFITKLRKDKKLSRLHVCIENCKNCVGCICNSKHLNI